MVLGRCSQSRSLEGSNSEAGIRLAAVPDSEPVAAGCCQCKSGPQKMGHR